MNAFAMWWRRLTSGSSAAPPVPANAGEPVDGFAILEKVAGLPISTWRYNWEPEHIRHLGPMAQDFKATFGLGDKDTRIPVVDASGVALVSIQALHRRLAELEREVAELKHKVGEASEK